MPALPLLPRILALLALLFTFAAPVPAREAPSGLQPAPPAVAASELPPEARRTLALIARDGPFPYRRDGVVFQNRERRLPRMAQGYYREYTVETPGSRDRGARRIIAGGDPPEIHYYTDDHYRSFRRVTP